MPASLPYVIVVDDDPDEGLLITRILSKMDPPVDLCLLNDGAEAIEKLSNKFARKPDLIIMDNKMPKHYGVEVIKELAEFQHIRQTPIVLMSAEFSRKEIRDAYEAGANSCVLKGDDSTEWARNLRAIITYWIEINRIESLAEEDY